MFTQLLFLVLQNKYKLMFPPHTTYRHIGSKYTGTIATKGAQTLACLAVQVRMFASFCLLRFIIIGIIIGLNSFLSFSPLYCDIFFVNCLHISIDHACRHNYQFADDFSHGTGI